MRDKRRAVKQKLGKTSLRARKIIGDVALDFLRA
jgi:hypothetical protein